MSSSLLRVRWLSSVLFHSLPQPHLLLPRTMATKCVNLDNLNPCIKVMEYAVRGPLVIRATEIEKELEQVSAKWRI